MSSSIYNPQVLQQLTTQSGAGDRVWAYLTIESTGETFPFLINPEKLQFSRQANFTKQSTAGTSIQSQQFYNSEGRSLKINNVLIETYRQGRSVSDYLASFEALLMPQVDELRWYAPRPLNFVWGSRQFGPCILTSLSWDESAWLSGEPASCRFSLQLDEIPGPDSELQRRLPPNVNEAAEALDTPLTERQQGEGSAAAQSWLNDNAATLDDELRDRVAANRYLLTTDATTGLTTITDEGGEAIGTVGRWDGREFVTDDVQAL